jgi:hypothetical protein
LRGFSKNFRSRNVAKQLRFGASGIHLVNPINAFNVDFDFFHGGTIKLFFGGLVKTKSPLSHSLIDLARKPRASLKDARTIDRLLAAE